MATQNIELSNARVVLVGGTDSAAQRKAVSDLIVAAGLTPDDMDIEQIIANEKSFQEWIGSACMIPFLADRRVVIVRNLGRTEPSRFYPEEKIGKKHPIAIAFSCLPPTTLLILVSDEDANIETDIQSSKKKAETAWQKIVKASDGKLIIQNVPTENLPKLARDHAAAIGKKMSAAAANLLMEMTANSIVTAKSDIETLALYVGDSPEIRIEDIESVVTPSMEYNIFKLVDAVTEGRTVAALNQLRSFLSAQKKLDEAIIGQIMPMILRQLRFLWQARTCVDARCFPANAPFEIKETFLSNPNFATQQDWLQRKLIQSAKRIGKQQIAECIHLVMILDGTLKGLHHNVDSLESVEVAVSKMCFICSGKAA